MGGYADAFCHFLRHEYEGGRRGLLRSSHKRQVSDVDDADGLSRLRCAMIEVPLQVVRQKYDEAQTNVTRTSLHANGVWTELEDITLEGTLLE